jgi:hypothetical protein
VPKKAKAKLIPAVEALHNTFDGAPGAWLPLNDVFRNMHDRLGRLSWAYTTKAPIEEARLVERLAVRDKWMIFPDSTVVIQDNCELWSELLSHERHIALITRVIAEVDGFLSRRPNHPLHRAIMSLSKAVLLRPDAKAGSPGSIAQAYYLALLVQRRSVFEVLRSGFALEHSREPDADEEATIRKMMDKELSRERLRLENKTPSPYFTDENLVYHAVLYALETGQPTVILSGDYDVAVYFRHIINLLLSHYRAMLIAVLYDEDSTPFQPQAIPLKARAGYFTSSPAVSIDLTEFRSAYPPPAEPSTPVPISCIIATAEHVSELIFNAETGMNRVIGIKGRTGGLSTDCLAGHNLHAWHVLPEVPHGRGVIATDIKMPLGIGDAGVPMADLLLSAVAVK